ncbi:galactose mutarotase-like domain-containing protein [Leucosporidium creatinivorum]|uniref:Galactose mutarotase-like domain-containing protein n=1 Tax=Leucosporidium creatinivorum TaxID=106004 RepID=A0A1Y2G5E4_9BASI|nr:galactose mutarotase-like domain-containing protein [Leucosporidium creatinivorum]
MFTIDEIKSDQLALQVLPYGLTFHGLAVTAPGGLNRDALISPHDTTSHHLIHGRRFLNQTVGRYANRLPSGKNTFGDGGELQLAGDDGVCLHGGETGLDTIPWDVVDLATSTLFTEADVPKGASSNTIYRHVSSAGTDGFPLGLEIEGFSAVSAPEADNAGKVTVILRARILEEGAEASELAKGTPVNLTVHWGFNLSDFATEDVKGHKMYINSNQTPTLDDKMLAKGTWEKISAGSELDFHSAGLAGPHRTLGGNFPAEGVDHNFAFTSLTRSDPQVVLTSPDDKLSLSFRTNQSTVQCYTASGFDSHGPARKSIHDPQSIGPYARFGAVFLEFHHPLATFLHPEYAEKAGTDTVLKAGDVYENFVEIEVKVKE